MWHFREHSPDIFCIRAREFLAWMFLDSRGLKRVWRVTASYVLLVKGGDLCWAPAQLLTPPHTHTHPSTAMTSHLLTRTAASHRSGSTAKSGLTQPKKKCSFSAWKQHRCGVGTRPQRNPIRLQVSLILSFLSPIIPHVLHTLPQPSPDAADEPISFFVHTGTRSLSPARSVGSPISVLLYGYTPHSYARLHREKVLGLRQPLQTNTTSLFSLINCFYSDCLIFFCLKTKK